MKTHRRVFIALAIAVAFQAYGAKVKLGPNVNSDQYEELSPFISADGSALYFTREDPNVRNSQHVFVSRRLADGSWGPAEMLPPPLNTSSNSYIFGVLPDNNTLFVAGYFDAPLKAGDGERGRAYSGLSRRTSGGWSKPERLMIPEFVNLGTRTGYSLAPGGQVMLISFKPENAVGGYDVLVSFRQKDGRWTDPANLWTPFNTNKNETVPRIAPDGKTVYFASDRDGGSGGYDVWMSRRLDDTWLKWSEPVNLGPEINTSGHDGAVSTDAAGTIAFISSGEVKKEDIYSVALPPAFRPLVVAFVRGHVRDPQGKPLNASVTYERMSDAKESGLANTDPRDGTYQLTLPVGSEYSFRGAAQGYVAASERADLSKTKPNEVVSRDLVLVPIRVGASIRLNNIFFDSAKAVLLPPSVAELSRLVDILNDNPAMQIEIAGHTDSEGDDASNLRLSDDRARAVMAYLTQHGIAAARLRAHGYGETKPVAPNSTKEGRQMNRRVEFTITKA
jgi:outer membrane protein OmpA-like peptidoglycan-associated protein